MNSLHFLFVLSLTSCYLSKQPNPVRKQSWLSSIFIHLILKLSATLSPYFTFGISVVLMFKWAGNDKNYQSLILSNSYFCANFLIFHLKKNYFSNPKG